MYFFFFLLSGGFQKMLEYIFFFFRKFFFYFVKIFMDFIGCLSSFILSRHCLEIRKRLHGPSIRVCVVMAFAWVAVVIIVTCCCLSVWTLRLFSCEIVTAHPTALRDIACWPGPCLIHSLCLHFGFFFFFLTSFFWRFAGAVASRHRPGHDSQADWHCSVKGNTAQSVKKWFSNFSFY